MKPHRLKAIAGTRKIVMLPIIVYTDDTSGNKSKQWNKFDAWCVKLAGLPKKKNSKLHNIHFVCCSNKMSVMDICKPLADELKKEGIEAYDVALQEKVLVVASSTSHLFYLRQSTSLRDYESPWPNCNKVL